MNDMPLEQKVLVQVVPVDEGREIGWGSNTAEELRNRLEDIRSAISEGAKAVANSLASLPHTEGWQLGEVSATFGISLTTSAGVILSTASMGATFEVTILYKHEMQAGESKPVNSAATNKS